MNRKIPFEKNELLPGDFIPGRAGRPDTPIRATPVSARENISAMYFDKHPYWIPTAIDAAMVALPLYNMTLGRGGIEDFTDSFGIEWEYVPQVNGAIVRPGEPFIGNANELKDKIKFPNMDEWDWEKAAEDFKVDMKRGYQPTLINGFWFERLVSFMEFGPAAVALIDDEQKDAVKAFFEESTEFAMKVVDKMIEYWPGFDGINIHDDWAGQKAPFFSMETAYEMFVPYMKALTDHIHSKGRYVSLHSCGHGYDRVQAFIDGGIDSWDPQPMNDTQALFEHYGDKIIIAVAPDRFDPETTSEEEQRSRARDFVDRFCIPGKPLTVAGYGASILTPAFSDELYEYSRKKYASF
ncbi:MAG: methyltransferase [Oscillospiraceae bacterium]|nr:methyltransferase [Oscillospiraceae bacterium]